MKWFVRHPSGSPRAAVGHMPFEGHRTVAEIWEEQERHAQLPWCPQSYRDEYRRLRAKGFSAAEARPMVEALISAEFKRSSNVPLGCGDAGKAYNRR